MNTILLICGILFVVIAIAILILGYLMTKSAKQADEMMHQAFLEEVEKIKEEHKDE